MSNIANAPVLKVEQLNKRYGDATIVKSATFAVQRGETVALLGPSGSGKTTTLRCIAGLERINGGRIIIGNTTVDDGRKAIPAGLRGIGMVFQNYALWPHMSVLDNVAFVAENQGKMRRPAARDSARHLLANLRLTDFAERKPTMISGGQQQRVAVARALAGCPSVLLMDEPLSALDTQLRVDLRGELRRAIIDSGLACVYVTHDQDEALSIADRLIVMNYGELVETGSPRNVYGKPQTLFGALFFGCRNTVSAQIEGYGADGHVMVRIDGAVIAATISMTGWRPSVGTRAVVAFRPRGAKVHQMTDGQALTGRVQQSMFIGAGREYRVALANDVIVAEGEDLDISDNQLVGISLDPGSTFVFPAS